jgi:hypothetical protein
LLAALAGSFFLAEVFERFVVDIATRSLTSVPQIGPWNRDRASRPAAPRILAGP